MTKTLVERLRDQFDYEREHYPPANPVLAAAASRIEELEAAQTGYRLALADVAVQADRYEREEIGGQELADTVGFAARQALSEPYPATPAKRIGAARYLEG